MSRPLAVLIVAASLSACDDGPLVPARTEATLQISVQMTGFLPSRTVSLVVDDTLPVSVSQPTAEYPEEAHGQVTLTAGRHHVAVTGLDPNCATPPIQEVGVSLRLYNSVTFIVKCAGDASLVGGGLAWVEDVDGWGNYLYFNPRNGDTRYLHNDGVTTDLAWSPGGNELATIEGAGAVVIFDILAERETRRVGSGLDDAAVTWGPGADEVSVLELRGACRIVILGPRSSTSEALACGAGTAAQQGAADIAWSPDGKLAAVAAYNAPTFRLVDRATGDVRHFPLPDRRYGSVAAAWAPDGGRVYVLGVCLLECAPGQLVLLSGDPRDGSWNEIGQWPTDGRAATTASLEVLDAKHLAVGPIQHSVFMISLDAPTRGRVLLGRYKFRVARRPG
jgi:hypothetical protein